jgi:hypothetical protein
MSFRRRKNKDFTKATYLALANVMKLLRIGIKREWLPYREEL